MRLSAGTSKSSFKRPLPPLPLGIKEDLKKKRSGHFITKYVREKLVENFNEERVRGAQLFFKEGFKGYGVTKNKVRWFLMEGLHAYSGNINFATSLLIGEQLFKSRMYEECQATILLLEKYVKEFDCKTLSIFSKWIDKYVENWGLCDSLCIKLISPFFINYPDHIFVLEKWVSSKNRWKRRAACVVLAKLCRKGQFISEGLHVASILVSDKDEMVQKGVGWLLKEISRSNLKSVVIFLEEYKEKIPKLVISYALELVEVEKKKDILNKIFKERK